MINLFTTFFSEILKTITYLLLLKLYKNTNFIIIRRRVDSQTYC